MNKKISLNSAIYTSIKEIERISLQQLPESDLPSFSYSPDFARRKNMDTVIKKLESSEKRKNLFKKIINIVIAFAVAFSVMFSPAMTATAVQQAVSQTYISWFEKYISVDTISTAHPQQIKDFTVGYMTEGYQQRNVISINNGVEKLFYNNNLYISIYISPSDGTITFNMNNENCYYYNVDINGIKALCMSHQDGYNRMLVTVEGIQYNIEGYVEIAEILKIYENIEISL